MKQITALLITILLFSCNTNKTPDYVIPQDDMVNIIIDMHLADGLFTISDIRKKVARADSINYYDAIFDRYGYTRHDFDTSVFYYSKNINEYDKIYEDVLNKLNQMETELKEKNTEEEKSEKLKVKEN